MGRIDTMVGRLRAQIEDGLLKPGEKLLSVRAAASEHGVSKNTVCEAYDRLVALGLLQSKQGSGYFVASRRAAVGSTPSSHIAEAIDSASLLREQLDQHYAVRVGDGRPPASWMERVGLGPQIAQLKHGLDSAAGYGYSTPWGYRPLRERIALMLGERGIEAAPEQILLTYGANHGLDLVARQLLEPDDVVLVDSPGYYPLFGKLRLSRIRAMGIPRLDEGPDLAALERACEVHRPKVFFTQSLGHNPTGSSITLPVAHRLLQLAEEFGFYIVEDDPFADILQATQPRLATLDQLKRVVYVGTFSKTLSANLRVGYVAAEPQLMDVLCNLKMLTVVNSSDLLERVVFNMIASGLYLRHLRRLKKHVDSARVSAIRALQGAGIALPYTHTGGYYLWGELGAGIDERDIAYRAAQESIFLAPGAIFRPEKTEATAAIRINIAYADNPQFLDFIARTSAAQRP
ncbi:MAG: PLP-dependent aminotransferase family protein [Proteobacteria bacterium]|nr:MAG: PLP-dependent aminotransferase family protein [Pseudomonadota bacterium]